MSVVLAMPEGADGELHMGGRFDLLKAVARSVVQLKPATAE